MMSVVSFVVSLAAGAAAFGVLYLLGAVAVVLDMLGG